MVYLPTEKIPLTLMLISDNSKNKSSDIIFDNFLDKRRYVINFYELISAKVEFSSCFK